MRPISASILVVVLLCAPAAAPAAPPAAMDADMPAPVAPTPSPVPILGAAIDENGMWEELPPPRRTGLIVAFDSQRGRMIAFGGPGGATWAFATDGTNHWLRIETVGAAPVGQHGGGQMAVYDPVRDRVLVYTGEESGAVYALDLTGQPTWSALAVNGTPPDPRFGHALVYDSARDRVLLSGGMEPATYTSLADTWQLLLTPEPQWSLLSTTGGPAQGFGLHVAIYDPATDQMVVFGGSRGFYETTTNETWTLHLEGTRSWTQVPTTGSVPDPRAEACAAYDPDGQRMIVFGGVDVRSVDAVLGLGDLSALSLSGEPQWTTLLAGFGSGPRGRGNSGMVYVPSMGEVFIHGGDDAIDQFADTWRANVGNSPVWQLVAPAPLERTYASLVFDPNRDRMLMFGGYAAWCSFACSQWVMDDAYEYSGDGWNPIVTTTPRPQPRAAHSAIFDPAGNRMLVFGGTDLVDLLNDTWELMFSPRPAWRLVPAQRGAPPPRRDAAAIYDAGHQRMVVFGGRGATGELNDVWLMVPGATARWLEAIPFGSPPPPRTRAAAIYDPVRGRMIVFGGSVGNTAMGDVWALEMAPPFRWTELHPAGAVPAIGFAHAIYDPDRDRMIISDGGPSALYALQFTPTLEWRTLHPAGAGPYNYGGIATAYDPRQHRMTIFGGGGAYGEYFNSIWGLQLGEPAASPRRPIVLPASAGASAPTLDPLSLAIDLSAPSVVTAAVYGVDGRRVRSLEQASALSGTYVVRWDGRDDGGQAVASGVYWIQAQAQGRRFARKVMRLH